MICNSEHIWTIKKLYDNKSVVKNSNVSASTWSKRHNFICYHWVREAHACGVITVQWIPGEKNLVDLLSKTTITRDLIYKFVLEIFYNFMVKVKYWDLEVGKKYKCVGFHYTRVV